MHLVPMLMMASVSMWQGRNVGSGLITTQVQLVCGKDKVSHTWQGQERQREMPRSKITMCGHMIAGGGQTETNSYFTLGNANKRTCLM